MEPPVEADGELLSVGEAAARMGVSASTLRSWGRRYGLVPEGVTPGGHRRFTPRDMARFGRMQDLVDAGTPPARAAAAVLAEAGDTPGAEPDASATAVPEDPAGSSDPDGADGRPAARPGGPGGAVLAVPGASPAARGLARAASRLDGRAVAGVLGDLLIERGTVATWEDVLRPVFVAVGERWARTGTGIEIEHVLSEATIEALRSHRALQPAARSGPPVVLACAAEDTHALPLHVLAAALAERHVASQVLGPRVPGPVAAAVARRVGARVVLVWRQMRTTAAHDLDAFPVTRARPLLVAAGPGWGGCRLPDGTARPGTLRDTVELLAPDAAG